MSASPPADAPDSPAPGKKAYRKPALIAYGDVREITQTIVGGMGMNDAIHGNDKTFP